MSRDQTLALFRSILPNLKTTYAVRSLGLFESAARDQAHADSEVDILVEFEETPGFVGLFAL